MGDTRDRNINGIGLGLMIVNHIVEQYEGKVWVVSNLGNGSDF